MSVAIACWITAAALAVLGLAQSNGGSARKATALGVAAGVFLFGGAFVKEAGAEELTLDVEIMTEWKAQKVAVAHVAGMLNQFTDEHPRIVGDCGLTDLGEASCAVRWYGDRLQARVIVTVREIGWRQYDVRFDSLTTIDRPAAKRKAKKKPIRWEVAPRNSWYGPGLYGNKLACGGRLHEGTIGVASTSLRCGTKLRLRYRGRYANATVIDYGPEKSLGRTFDLTEALRNRLGYVTDTPLEYRRIR